MASGEAAVARHLDPWLPGGPRGVALDIGCGLGRLARALAVRFERVEAVDISPEMIERARRFAPPSPSNVAFAVCDGSGRLPVASASVDVAFSYLVLQHVPRSRIIATYLAEISRVLVPGGLARLQVNGSGRPLRRRISMRIVESDRVPVIHRKPRIKVDPRSTMGVVVTEARARRQARRAALRVEAVDGQGTAEMWLTLRRPLEEPR